MPILPMDQTRFLGAADRVAQAGPKAVLLRARYAEDRFTPALFADHSIARPPSLATARDRRLAEFLAGRMLAQQALAKFGAPPGPIGIAPDRRPLFPSGLSGSISHARGFVACLVTQGADPGVDIEACLSGDALVAVKHSVLTENDKEMLGPMDPLLVTAVFSAKETLFKALYPSVGRLFGFEAATLTAPPGPAGLTLRLCEPLGADLPIGRQYDISADYAGDHVLTWLIQRREPGQAVPGHG
jgi:4'-phosphopantetheinyl transferase EntD